MTPETPENRPAKFGKMLVRISGVLYRFGGTVFRQFESYFEVAFSAKGSFCMKFLILKACKKMFFWRTLGTRSGEHLPKT